MIQYSHTHAIEMIQKMIQMIQYPHTDTTEDDLEDYSKFMYRQNMIQHVQKMIQYLLTKMPEYDLAEINDEDV